VTGIFNSFRVPGEMRYQSTYLYPPKTTLLGMIGAALGLEEEELESLAKLQVGIRLDRHGGVSSDLWRIAKLKAGGAAESAVVIRQIVHDASYTIYIASEEPTRLTEIQRALRDPAYPLTLGRSDELVIAEKVEEVQLEEAADDTYYTWTVVPFDYRQARHQLQEIKPGMAGTLPQVFNVATSFSYSKRVRRAVTYAKQTHVYDLGLMLPENKGWTDGELSFFTF